MAAGTVTIDGDGNASGSGASRRLYDLMLARAQTQAGDDFPEGEDSVPVKEGIASLANDLGSWLVTELQSHCAASVSTSLSGLQRMPASTAENTDTKAPGTTKTIPLVHT